ncbi:hypothetical protein G6K93_31780 [Agrobacterium rhizogenes]|nr:hypothetical protein [Rhizobium rhizogenes]NTF78951.1 hypothetical protein [Rhizobium rhizogenes]NTJ51592.1 hypothetical protein [Rhizobium rhizogenes]
MISDDQSAEIAEQQINMLRIRYFYIASRDELRQLDQIDEVLSIPGAMYLVRSSGTSGVRKCSVVSYSAINSLCGKISSYFSESDIHIRKLYIINGVEFGYFVWDIILASLFARDVVFTNVDHLVTDFTDHQCFDAISLTPTMLSYAVACGAYKLPKYIFLSGEKVNKILIDCISHNELLGRSRVFSSYALTETGGQLSMVELTQVNMVEGLAGELLSGVELIFGESHSSGVGRRINVCCNTMASLRLHSGGLFPMVTNGQFQTDDYGYINSAGFLFLTHRISHRPKRNGKIVDLDGIRDQLLNTYGFDDVIIEVYETTNSQLVVANAFLLSHRISPPSTYEILIAEKHNRPDLLIVMSDLSFSHNGKFLPPFLKIKNKVANDRSLSTVLNLLIKVVGWLGYDLDSTSYDIGLVDLGVTSLDMVIIRDAVESLFGQSVSILDIYRQPNLVELARFITERLGEDLGPQ